VINAAIPIMAVSASAMRGDQERMRQAGCNRYVEKPIEYKKLLAEIEELCNRRQAD